MLFCPSCGNMLVCKMAGNLQFACQTCLYLCPVKTVVSEKHTQQRKKADDILGGEDAWAGVEKTEAQCPNKECESTSANFFQMQTRSADEPMTIFYRCVECGERWKEG
eukprot:NODE_2971_length_472_cov_37.631884_g2921_i0.p2 GENE.NODE_2971_length_472_cov_37.631884_g2921_i0~~NODE_2971_length_472_cov_37.631884_g2921_i0.p2  ORF type:complete len:108 (+),score=2.19 NODE_2971_length_472_cov_37.631884_g2921_i0:74-397(+)